MAQYSFASVKDGYRKLWSQMRVIKVADADRQAKQVIAHKARYLKVQQSTSVPWFAIGCLHMRESNGNFNTWLHNGDPMRRNGQPIRTVHVPKGRPPNPAVSWEDGAYDALVTIEHLDEITDWGPEHVAYAAEKFNGWGYRNPTRNIPSPYLWGGTSVQKRGKFVADGVYDANTMDPQLGAMAVLKRIMELDESARFTAPSPLPDDIPPTEDLPPPLSPTAEDTEAETKPLTKSKTIWGSILAGIGGLGGTLAGAFEYIATPWGFAALVFIVLVIAVGTWLVIKGRFDVNKVVKHLSQDDK